MEEAATQIVSWQTGLVPGLLQTREYRRALLWAEFPDMPSQEVESSLDVLMRRQELLDKADLHFEALIAESVLHSVIGGPSVIEDQLSQLLAVSQRPNVTLRIVGRDAKDPVGVIAGSFVFFDLPPLPTSRMRQPPVVYLEGYLATTYVETVPEVTKYSQVMDRLRRVAHSEEKSRALVSEALEVWEQ
jgi:hypothetical protein